MNTVRHLDLTVIMPIAPGADPKPAIRAIEKSIPKGITAELITVTGKHPTRQRNLAAFRAKGRILWFLDHDAIPNPEAARLLLREFGDPSVAVAGGPNLAAHPRTALEGRAAMAIASSWGSPFVADRYRQRGEPRSVGEHSLILCNLMVRKAAFLAAGGFDPRLYPNEENELMNRFSAAGASLRHVPAATVIKGRPKSWAEFLTEAFRYGRGRAHQMWIAPAIQDVIHALGAVASILLLIAAIRHPWHGVAVLGLVGVFTIEPMRLWLGSRLLMGVPRLLAYAAGLLVGSPWGWRARGLQLAPLPADFNRFMFGSGSFRLSESSSFDLGSITMKGAFKHA